MSSACAWGGDQARDRHRIDSRWIDRGLSQTCGQPLASRSRRWARRCALPHLVGIDDSAPDVGAALALARSAAASGVRVIAATPHVRADHPRVCPTELGERCDALRERLREAEIGVEVIAGGEVDLAWSRGASDEELALVSYAQRGATCSSSAVWSAGSRVRARSRCAAVPRPSPAAGASGAKRGSACRS